MATLIKNKGQHPVKVKEFQPDDSRRQSPTKVKIKKNTFWRTFLPYRALQKFNISQQAPKNFINFMNFMVYSYFLSQDALDIPDEHYLSID